MIIDERTKQILSTMRIDGNTTTITETLDRKEYVTVNEVLETLGGTWNRKQKCHVWTCSPSETLSVYINGNAKTITTSIETKKEKKKKFQFFGTPDDVADKLVESLQWDTWKPSTVLETSAGQGALVQAINRWLPKQKVDCYELMPENVEVLKTIPNANIIGDDFFKRDMSIKYDCIIQNPPFAKNQDIDFIKSAYESLADGGRMVSVSSRHWEHSTRKKELAFVEWLSDVNANVYPIESGAFKESGTMIGCNYITFWKI